MPLTSPSLLTGPTTLTGGGDHLGYGGGVYGTELYGLVSVGPGLKVRELPPLRTHIEAVTPSGRHYRWGEDETDPANVPSGLRHSSTMPGGYESMDCTLPRKPGIDYSDLERLTTLRVWGAGGDLAGEYRLERTPRVSGDAMAVSPSAVGYQTHLEDDKSARMIYVDTDMTRWQEATSDRKLALSANTVPMGKIPVQIGGQGGIIWTPPNEALPTGEECDIEYDIGPGLAISAVFYKGTETGLGSFEAATIFLAPAAIGTFASSEALTLDGANRSATSFTDDRWAMLRLKTTTGVTPAAGAMRSFTAMVVYGNHGAPLTSGGQPGILASDVVVHAVGRWAPMLSITAESVQASSFSIPHLSFPDTTTAGEIIRQATRFGLQDWAVWDGPTFWWHPRGAFGRSWRARIGSAQLEETGPQVDRLWNSVIVQYQDVDGSTRTVGPVGSGSDTEDAVLEDVDPDNPATLLGVNRREKLVMGIGTAASAIEVGRRFLEESKVLDRSGRARLVGYVTDDRGVVHPYWRVKAGDTISFVDAADSSPRRIVRVDHDRPSRTASVDLDAPPEGLQALLERLGVVLEPLGI